MYCLDMLKKQGGMKLIKQYFHAGALGAATVTFFTLGRSKKALEILRLVATFKTVDKLRREYNTELEHLLTEYHPSQTHIPVLKRRVWVCWLQGMDQAPLLVKQCYKSLQDHITDREIVLLTEKNYGDYVQFPDYVVDKIERGIISRTHMSDLLRLELLTRYGGTWIDATVFCTARPPAYMMDDKFFAFQLLKPGLDGQSTGLSNWFITAEPGAKLLVLTLKLLYKYWSEHDEIWDYFIFHDMFQLVIEKCPEEWHRVVPFSNSVPHILLLRLFEKYDERIWKAVQMMTPFHKLSYKFQPNKFGKEGTYYKQIVESNIG